MKKFAAGLLTAFCATAFSFAQTTDQIAQDNWVDAQPAAQADGSFNTQTPIETQSVQTTSTTEATVAAPATTQTAPTQAATTQATAAPQDQSNDPMPIDEQAAPAPKRAPIGIGARAAFIYGNMWGFKDLKADGLEPPTGIGGEFGITARFSMAAGLDFSPEISFRIFDVSHDEDEIERCYNQMFLDFSFYLRAVFGGGFFLEFAPQISLNTSAEYTYDGTKNDFERIEQATAEFGLNVGVGYFVIDNLSLNFRWYMGLTEVFPDVKYEGDMNSIKEEKSKNNVSWATINLKGAHTMMFKFGVTYWFI
jgi:hypothetical protein